MKDQFGKAFCVLPWLHSFVNIGGEYQVCCTSEEFHEGITDSNHKIFNIKDNPSLNDVMNSDFMKQVRLDLLDGKMPKLCSRCIITENHQGVSRRHLENSKYAEEIPKLIEMTKPDGTIPLEIKSADYRLGNICNLQCRMCNPRSTVMWLKDWNNVKQGREVIDERLRKEYENYDWIDESYLLSEFEEKIQGLDTLHFAGGEPLIAPRMHEMLQLCIDKGVAQNIMLTYNTNITKLPPKVLELWKHFKEVRLLCSIDGFEKVNEYIRMPVKWDVVDKNLRYLDSHAEEHKITEILLSCTVQAYNVLNLNQLYQYLRTFKNVVKAPNLINLYGPDYLGTKILPKKIKEEATNRLMQVKEEVTKILPTHKHYLLENIDQVILFMNSKDLNPHLWGEFIKYNQRLDKTKGLSMKDFIPELYEAIQEQA